MLRNTRKRHRAAQLQAELRLFDRLLEKSCFLKYAKLFFSIASGMLYSSFCLLCSARNPRAPMLSGKP